MRAKFQSRLDDHKLCAPEKQNTFCRPFIEIIYFLIEVYNFVW